MIPLDAPGRHTARRGTGVLLKALDKDQARRFASAGDFAKALEAAAAKPMRRRPRSPSTLGRRHGPPDQPQVGEGAILSGRCPVIHLSRWRVWSCFRISAAGPDGGNRPLSSRDSERRGRPFLTVGGREFNGRIRHKQVLPFGSKTKIWD